MRSSVKSSKRRKDLTGQAVRRSVLLLLSLALILSAGGCSKQSTEEVPQLLDPVTVEAGTVTVKRGDLANITYINVSVVPKTEKMTFAREGQISAIHVAAGDQVTKGQVLAELDLTDLSKEIDRQSAQLDFQKNQDDLAETAAYDTLLAAQADQQAAQAAYQEAYQALTQAQEQAAKQQTAASDPAEENSQPAREESSTAGQPSSAENQSKGDQSSVAEPSDSGSSSSGTSDSQTTGKSASGNESSTASESSDSSSSAVQSSQPQTPAQPESSQSQESSGQTETSAQPESSGQAQEDEGPSLSDLQEALTSASQSLQYANLEVSRQALIYQHTVQTDSLEEAQSQAALDRLSAKKQGTLTAPFDGVVVAVNKYEGETAQEEDTIIVLADETQLCLEGEPYDNDALSKAAKLKADIGGRTIDVTYRPYQADDYLKRIMRQETPNTYFDAADPEDLTLGQTGTLMLYRGEKTDVLYVPISCVIKDEVGSYVYKDEDGQRTKTYISTGLETVSYVEVTDGLEEGDVLYDN